MDKFTFACTLDRAEHVRCVRALYNSGTSTKIAYALLGMLAIAVGAAWLVPAIRETSDHFVFGSLLFVIGGAAVSVYFQPLFSVWRVRRNNPGAAGPCHIESDPTGVVSRMPGIESSIELKSFAEVWETREFFYFQIAPASALPLPKRLIRRDESTRLRAALWSWVGKEKCSLITDD